MFIDTPATLLKKAISWKNTVKGVVINPISSVDKIADAELREKIQQESSTYSQDQNGFRHGRQFWYEPSTNTLNVFLPNFTNTVQLDRALMEEVVGRFGLAGILGEKSLFEAGAEVFDNLNEQTQRSELSKVIGFSRSDSDRAIAGKRHLVRAAELASTFSDPERSEKAKKHWAFLVHNRIRNHNPEFWNMLSLDYRSLADSLGKGMRAFSFKNDIDKDIQGDFVSYKESTSRFIKLNNDFKNGARLDRSSFILLGRPSDEYLSTSYLAKNYPFEFPYASFLGDPEDDYGSMFVTSDDAIKYNKHPFSFEAMKNVLWDINHPLAVFRSRNASKRNSLCVMARSRNMDVGAAGNFFYPITPKEVFQKEDNGLRSDFGSGRWINHIDSVYPLADRTYINRLVDRSKVVYLDPEFESTWFNPTVDRLQRRFVSNFLELGITVPTDEELEQYRLENPVYDTERAQKNIAQSQDKHLDRAGLLSDYAAFRAAVESATKVVKEFERPKIISHKKIEFSINKHEIDLNKWFNGLSLKDKCRFLGFKDEEGAWGQLVDWNPDGPYGYNSQKLSVAINNEFNSRSIDSLKEKYTEWLRDGMEKHSETYRLATEATMYTANKLNQHGIRTVIVSDDEARNVLASEKFRKSGADFSFRDIMNLSYTWNGEDVSMRGFAEQFMSEIKQKDRTIEDAERIAKAFIEAVKADPEKAGMKMLRPENMSNAFRFRLPDGSVYTPEHPKSSSPEYETQKELWMIYENVLGSDNMREFISLLSKNAPMSADERKRFSEMESRVNGSNMMQRSLEIPASKVNENRIKDIRNLIQYFEGNDDYTWTEKALIVKGAMSFGYSEKKDGEQTKVEIKNISDNNSVSVPVIGGEAAAVVEGLRKGMNFKESLVQARIALSKQAVRSVARNFTGWKVYRKSDKEEDAILLNKDVAGTGWCTGVAVSTARSHLSGGDFHVYFEAGEPLIAIRTINGRMAEPPRGAHEGQFCTDREEQIAFDYIKGNNGITAGNDYTADIEDIRKLMSPGATWEDAFIMPDHRRYENGEFGDDTSSWGKTVEERRKTLLRSVSTEERHAKGYYYTYELGNESLHKDIPVNVKILKGEHLYITERIKAERLLQLIVQHVDVYENSSLDAPLLQSVGGDVDVRENATLDAPLLQSVGGYVDIRENSSINAPQLHSVGGMVDMHENSSLDAPLLQSVGGDVDVRENATLDAPQLQSVGRTVFIRKNSSLDVPQLQSVGGNVELLDNASINAPQLQSVGENVRLFDNASINAPQLQSVGANVEIFDNASFNAPQLRSVGRGVYVGRDSSLDAPLLQSVGENVRLFDNASINAPQLHSVGGMVDMHENSSLDAPLLQSVGGNVEFFDIAPINAPQLQHQAPISFSLSDGTIYGYQLGDTIYLTKAGLNPNTPIHEYTHLWAKVYERLHPEDWEALKEELKTLPQWNEIASSEGYSFIEADENRLAGEVLAYIIGNKGEELQMRAAKETIENRTWKNSTRPREVKASAAKFKEIVTNMVVKDVFDAEDLDTAGEVTLKVLQDFAAGKGVKITKEEGKRLAAMAEMHDTSQENLVKKQWEDAVYAPNGKLSNLSKEDYEYTRSGAFKRIVGDWESARIINQARNAWVDESSKNRTNFIPSEAFISEVKRLTGMDARLVVILDDSIRHIKNHHGSREEQRGQVDMTPEDIATIPYVINNFDSIVRAPDYDNPNGGIALTVSKRINGYSYIGIISRGKRNEIVISAWNRKTSAALDASIKNTPGLYVRNDTDLIAKVKKDIELIKQSAENVLIPFDENGEPTAEAVDIVRRIDALDLVAAQEENRGLFEQGNKQVAQDKVFEIENEISTLKERLVFLSKKGATEKSVDFSISMAGKEEVNDLVQSKDSVMLNKNQKDKAMLKNNNPSFEAGLIARDSILAHIDKVIAQYSSTQIHVSKNTDGTIVRQYGDFDYEQLYGSFERSKNLVLIGEVDGNTLLRKSVYTMSADSHGRHKNGFVAEFDEQGNLKSYHTASVRTGSDEEFSSSVVEFSPNGQVLRFSGGDYEIDPHIESLRKEYEQDIRSWFQALSHEDKMRVFGYYRNNPDNDLSPIGTLIDEQDRSAVQAAYEIAIKVPFDVPEVDEVVIRSSIDRDLTSAFNDILFESAHQMYKETTAAGIPDIQQSLYVNDAKQNTDKVKKQSVQNNRPDIKLSSIPEYFCYEIILPDRVISGTPDRSVPIHAPSEMCTDAGLVGNYKAGEPVVALDGKKYMEVPDEGLYLLQLQPGHYELLTRAAFNKRFYKVLASVPGGKTMVAVKQGVKLQSATNRPVLPRRDHVDIEMAVRGSQAYLTLLERLTESFHKDNEIPTGDHLYVAHNRALAILENIERNIGYKDFFTPGYANEQLIDANSGENHNMKDAAIVMRELRTMLAPLGPHKDIMEGFNIPAMTGTSPLGLSPSAESDMLEDVFASAFKHPIASIRDMREHLRELSKESQFCIDLTLPGSPSIGTLSEIIERTEMAKVGDNVFVKEVDEVSNGLIFMQDKFDRWSFTYHHDIPHACLTAEGLVSEYLDENALYKLSAKIFDKQRVESVGPPGCNSSYVGSILSDCFDNLDKRIPEMNYYQLVGLQAVMKDLFVPIGQIHTDIVSNSPSTERSRYLMDEAVDKYHALFSKLSNRVTTAENEFKRYVERGMRTNNTLADRILGRTFRQSVPLPDKETIKEVADKEITQACREEYNKIASEGMPRDVKRERDLFFETSVIDKSELKEMSNNIEKQLELTGRVDGPVMSTSGEMLLVQQDGHDIRVLHPEEAKLLVENAAKSGTVTVGGTECKVDLDNIRHLSIGVGQHLKAADDTGEVKYVVLDIKTQKLVEATPFDKAIRSDVRKRNDIAREKEISEGIKQTQTQTTKKGTGGRK